MNIKVNKLKNFISKHRRVIRRTGFKSYLEYLLAKKGELIEVTINQKKIFIRKGTPDLEVALSCLRGEFDVLKHIYPKSYDGIIIDAGGYIGTAAIALNELYPKAKIISIEASKENFFVLKKNTSSIKNIEVIYGALVAGNKKKVLLKNRGTGEWGYTAVVNPLDNINAKDLHLTPALNLQSLGIPLDRVGILKIDIEGGELDLFKNDSKSLNMINIIMIELHERIAKGCNKAFFKFSKDRIVIKNDREKFLSIKK